MDQIILIGLWTGSVDDHDLWMKYCIGLPIGLFGGKWFLEEITVIGFRVGSADERDLWMK